MRQFNLLLFFMLLFGVAFGQGPNEQPKVQKTTINGWQSDTLSMAKIQQTDSFLLLNADCVISSFLFIIDPSGDRNPFVASILGNKIGYMHLWKELKPGDRVIINKIKAQFDTNTVNLSPISFIISD